jgi:hypothetical protein
LTDFDTNPNYLASNDGIIINGNEVKGSGRGLIYDIIRHLLGIKRTTKTFSVWPFSGSRYEAEVT